MSCGVPSAWPTSLDGLLSLGKAQSKLKEQKKIGGAKACGLRRGALCMASRPPLSTKTGSYEKTFIADL